MEVNSADLAPTRDAYERGMYLDAYAASQSIGPLRDWESTPARVLAGRLAIQLGAPRTGRLLHLLAFRATPTNPEATYYHARYVLERHGPLRAWRFMTDRAAGWEEADPVHRADWLGLFGFVHSRLRDFERAEWYLHRAEQLAPDKPWVGIERAAYLESAERPDDALQAARGTLEKTPWFRPGVQSCVHLLGLLGRHGEALALAREGCDELQSGILAAQLAALEMDLGEYRAAADTYERFRALSPLLEKKMFHWLDARRADVSYLLGDAEAAGDYARQAGEEFYDEFAARLTDDAAVPARSTIGVNFPPPEPFQQPTPAGLLAALAAHWGRELDPPESEALAPDGLADPRDRQWAEGHGFLVREFTLTAEAAAALIGRGAPFLLTTAEGGFVQGAAVTGFDPLRLSLWGQSRADRFPQEAPLKPLLERGVALGPRCLVMVPGDRAGLLDGLDLPESGLYDLAHRVTSSLAGNDRRAAAAALDELAAAAPDHRLVWQARSALARYDAHPARQLVAGRRLGEMFPKESTYRLIELACTRDLGMREDRFDLLGELCRGPDVDPLYGQHYAQSLLGEGRAGPRAGELLESAIRKRPFSPSAHYIYANWLWERRDFRLATQLYRFAACLDESDGQLAESYFRACTALGAPEEAMRFLRTRFRRTKRKQPAATYALFYALTEQQEMVAAFDVLEEGVRARPDDGDMQVFLAEMRANYNEPGEAEALLEQAEGKLPEAARQREIARLNALLLRLPESLAAWRRVLEAEPLAPDALRNAARLIGELHGRREALAHLNRLCEEHPYHYPLRQLQIDLLRGEAPGEAEPVIRELIEQCPEDSWARRELALHLANLDRFDEALEQLDESFKHDPRNSSYYYSRGHVLFKADRDEESAAAYREAVELAADHEVAVGELFTQARGEDQQRDVMDFLADEFLRQPYAGDSILVFRDHAAQLADHDELLATLQKILEERQDAWQAWSATVQQLNIMLRHDEALSLARQAAEAFPLLPKLWVDLAEVHDARGDADARIDALRQAVRLSPTWGVAARELADAYEENKQFDDARAVLEQAIARGPFDPLNHGYLAETLWQMGDHDDALDRLSWALRYDPGYEGAWRTYADWAEAIDAPERVKELARELVRLRPGDVRAWVSLSRTLTDPADAEEAVEALTRATELNPQAVEARDLKAERLADLGRFDEALETAEAESFEGEVPLVLQGRAAWVEARRGNFEAAIAAMQALVAVEPNYNWGWQQLAEWHNEAGDSDGYLRAADELVRLRPDSPMALAMRGDAKLQAGDRDGGKEDLAEAHRLAPGYPFAGMLLFDVSLTDHELETARSVLIRLQEHAGGPFVLARQVQLAAREGNREEGIEALDRLARADSDSAWPVQSAVAAMRGEGWAEEVDKSLRDAWESGEAFHPWAALTWLDGEDGQTAPPEDRLRALDLTIDQHPHFVQAYDCKAELLTRLRRFGEAEKACDGPPGLGELPLILRGRRAWVLWAKGEPDRAIDAMRDTLESAPDYFWGWQQIANWYETRQSYREYLNAADVLVRLAPRDPTVYGYRGEAKLYLEDRAGAKEDFAAAFEIDPAYAFAGLHLFDEQFTAGEDGAAGETLTALREHVGGPYVEFRAVRQGVRRGDAGETLAAFSDVARDADAPPVLVEKSAEAIREAGWGQELDEALGTLVEDEAAHPLVGRYWMEAALTDGRDGDALRRLPGLLSRGAVGQEALWAYVDHLGGRRDRAGLGRCLDQHGDDLRESDTGWAKAGRALLNAGDAGAAGKWLTDWDERPGLEAWMLTGVADAARATGRFHEAERAHTAALDEADADPSLPHHQIWLAYHEALKGEDASARDRIASIEVIGLDDESRLVLAWAEAMLRVSAAAKGERGEEFAAARRDAGEAIDAFADGLDLDSGLRQAYHRFVGRLAESAASPAAWLWKMRQRIRPKLR